MNDNQLRRATTAAPEANIPPRLDGAGNRVRIVVIVLLLTVALVGGRMWWRGLHTVETDNAYLAAHVSVISPRIAGVVTKVSFIENQVVHAGDVLVELDAADQTVRVAQMKAQLMQQEAHIEEISALTAQYKDEAASVSELAARAEVQLKKASADALRYEELVKMQASATSKSEVDAAMATRDGAAADVRSQQRQAKAAQEKASASHAALSAAMAQKEYFEEQLKEAQQQLAYTRIVAPVSGRIGKKNVEVGMRIQAGQSLFAIVQDGAWVTANFKETQLHGLRVGQTAHIHIDAIPDRTFLGRIDSFSPASGAQFSLLPPDNATGNFTKIVQRIPVKITFDAHDLADIADRFAPGMSAVVEVDLSQPDSAQAAVRQ